MLGHVAQVLLELRLYLRGVGDQLTLSSEFTQFVAGMTSASSMKRFDSVWRSLTMAMAMAAQK